MTTLADYLNTITLSETDVAKLIKSGKFFYHTYTGSSVVYCIEICVIASGQRFVKVGFTTNLANRLVRLFRVGTDKSKYSIRVLESITYDTVRLGYAMEQEFHRRHKPYRVDLPWGLRQDLRRGHTEVYHNDMNFV